MPECEGCGASISSGQKECPYCGHVLMKIVAERIMTKEQSEAYRIDSESGTVHFGNGQHGARPEATKDSISSGYRVGGGKEGKIICRTCKHENLPINRRCAACGATLKRKILHRPK